MNRIHRLVVLGVAALFALSSLPLLAQQQPAQELLTPQPADAPTTQPKPLVHIERGTLPIILSAPHGGRMAIPGASVRKGENFVIKRGVKNNFATGYDGPVDVIALTIADELEKLTGERPYIVVANFARRYVDANRTPQEAYESEAARLVYEEYHNAIRDARAEIIANHRRGLLIDIHGHGRKADLIIRGTADWTSVRHAIEEFGKEAITGKDGLLGPLGAAKFTFLPPLANNDDKEFTALNGGFITRHYGSYAGGAFDAIQFELGSQIRRPDNIPAFAKAAAEGIAKYQDKYILNADGDKKPATQRP